MDDYISRQATIEAFENADKDVMADYGEHYGCEWGFSIEAVNQTINSIPTEDVRNIVYGKKIHTKKHKWAKEKNGEIDFFAWADGYCNGPLCVECGEHFCIHCVEREGGEEAVNEKLKAETCEERIVCSICGREVPEDAPYCNCGAMMMEE